MADKVDNISIWHVRAKMKQVLRQKYECRNKSIFDEMKFDAQTFDWAKYAEMLNDAKEDKEAFKFAEDDTDEMKLEKSFMQLLNEIVNTAEINEAINAFNFEGEDIATDDETITAEELAEYFKNINALDGDEGNLTFDDFAQLMLDNEVDIEKFGVSKEEEEEAVTPTSPTSPTGPTGPTGPTNTGGGDDPSKYDETIFPPDNSQAYPVGSPDFNAQTTSFNENLFDLTNMSAADMVGVPNADGMIDPASNDMTQMSNISQEDRFALQQLATQKVDYKKQIDAGIEALEVQDAAQKEALTQYISAVDAQSTAQEQFDGATIQFANLNNEKANIDNSIISTKAYITDLSNSKIKIPQEVTNAEGEVTNLDEIRAAKARNAEIEAQIKAAKLELENYQTTLEALQPQIDELDAQLKEDGAIGGALKTANEAVTAAEETMAGFGENLETSVQDYMTVVKDYQEVCKAYTDKKKDIMSKMNDQITTRKTQAMEANQELKNQAIEIYQSEVVQNEQGENVWATDDNGESYADNYKVDENVAQDIETYEDLKALHSGKVKPEEVSDEARALYEECGPLLGNEESVAMIEKTYGSVDDFFKMLSVVKDEKIVDSNGNEILYSKVLLNPENYKNLDKYIANWEQTAQNATDETPDAIASKLAGEGASPEEILIAKMFAGSEMYGTNAYGMYLSDAYEYTYVNNTVMKVVRNEETGEITYEPASGEEALRYDNAINYFGYADLDDEEYETPEGEAAIREMTGAQEHVYIDSNGNFLTKEEFEDLYNIDLDEKEQEELEEELEEQEEELEETDDPHYVV